MYTGSYKYITNNFFLMVSSVTFLLGPQTSELCSFHSDPPLFQMAPSFAVHFVDKLTEHKHFLTVNVLGVFQQSPTETRLMRTRKGRKLYFQNTVLGFLGSNSHRPLSKELDVFSTERVAMSPHPLDLLPSLLGNVPSA